MNRRGPLGGGQVFEWWKFQGPAGGSLVILPMPLPRPMPEADVRAAVRTVVARHEALRTIVELDEAGRPRQVVLPDGEQEIRFETFPDKIDREDPDLVAMLWYGQFDVERELPVWACLFVTDTGAVAEVDLAFSHISMDAGGTAVVKREIVELLTASWEGRAHRLAPVERQLLDIVAAEERSEAADEYWRRRIAMTPSRLFPSREHTAYRLYSGTVVSPTAPATLAVAAQRYRSTPAVLYASLVTTVLAIVSGGDRIGLSAHYHGRSAEAADVVGCFHRILLTTVDVSDEPPLSQILKRVAAETLAAQRRHRIPWTRMRELFAAETRRRGAEFADGTILNFDIVDSYEQEYRRSGSYSPRDLRPPGPDILLNPRELVDGDQGMDAYLMVRVATDAVTVQGGFNGGVLRRAEMDALMRGPELILFEALRQGDLTFAGIRELMWEHGWPARFGASWMDGCLVDPERVDEVLAGHPDVIASRTAVESERLTAYVGTDNPALSPWALRDWLLSRVGRTTSLVCPAHFAVRAGVPDRRDDLASWRRLPRIAEGDGRDELDEPRGEAHDALRRAVAAFNEIGDVALTRTYLEQGGELLVVPAVLRRLAGLGLIGLRPDDFLRPVPLRQLAEQLRTPSTP